MDVAVNLVESYLRLNGYLTLSELEIQGRTKDGSFETLTDVDIVALRFPGPVYAADPHDDDCQMLLIEDPVLQTDAAMVDFIIGEVKQGEAVFNPGLKRHEVLHSVLRRIEWLLAEPSLSVVERLQQFDVVDVPTRAGGQARIRLVAFGRSPVNDLHTVSISHIVNAVVSYMEEFEDVLRPAQFKDPAAALLRLLAKTGFSVEKRPESVD